MRHPMLLAFLSLSIVGCHMGARAETMAVATSPVGATANLTLAQGSTSGELLAVEDTGLLILRGQSLVPVSYSVIRIAAFPDVGVRYSIDGRVPNLATIRSLRLVSHFPQGMSKDIRATLAARYRAEIAP